jgi:hypothetical protein
MLLDQVRDTAEIKFDIVPGRASMIIEPREA